MRDDNVVKNFKKNTYEVFERIFNEMSPKLYKFALSYTMNADVAEDIVQDTFVNLW